MKQSAGILVWREKAGKVEVLLVHPGGPFWAKKDEGAWSIPKGEYQLEEPLEAAQREFTEETDWEPPKSDYSLLGEVKTSGKTVLAWAVKGDYDVTQLKSNTFSMEWPPKSGKAQEFPEVDKAEWFELDRARIKINKYQVELIEKLEQSLAESR